MKVDWTKDVYHQNEKIERRELVRAQSAVLKVLAGILERNLAELTVKRTSLNAYDVPNWSQLQADYNATERTYRYLLTLLDPEENKHE